MACSKWHWFILISCYLLPYFCSASRTQHQRKRQADTRFGVSKRNIKGRNGFLDQLKMCYINENLECSRHLLRRAQYIPTNAIPFIRNLEQLEQLFEFFSDISTVTLDSQDYDTGRTVLMNCCLHGSYSAATFLVQHNVDLDLRDSLGNTALMLLITNGHQWQTSADGLGLFRALLARSELTLTNNMGLCFLDMYTMSPSETLLALNSAINRNEVDVVDRILSLKSAETIPYSFVPLIQSHSMAEVVVRHGGERVVPYLTLHHPITGFTILHTAVVNMNYKFVKYLLNTCHCPIDVKDRFQGESPVSLALLLLSKVVDEGDVVALNKIVLRLFEDAGDQLAEIYADDPIAELMDQAGDVLWEGTRDLYERLSDWESWTITRMNQVFTKHPSIKKGLVKLGFDVKFTKGLSRQLMNKALKNALIADDLNSIGFLLHYEAPTDGIIEHIRTPGQVAQVTRSIGDEAYQQLLETLDENGFTKFHHAVINADYPLVKRYLMILHANPNLTDELGRTCLMIALDCTRSRDPHTYDMIIQLLTPYTDTSIRDAIGRSPVDMIDKRVVYKKLLRTTVFMVADQQNKRHLVARDMAFYQTLRRQ